MPDRSLSVPQDGETRFGSSQVGQGLLFIQCPSGTVSVFALQDSAAVTNYLWFDTSGRLRTDTALPADPNADGTIVGTQS